MTNNRASNLQWKTKSQNSLDKARHGTMLIGPKNHATKLTGMQVEMIRCLCNAGKFSLAAIAEQFGIHHVQVINIRDGLVWKHLP